MSLRWRLLISFGLIILIALGTVAVVTRYRTEQEVQTFLGHGGQIGLENLANSLEAYYAENGSWNGLNENFRQGQGQGRGQGQRASSNTLGGDHVLADDKGVILISSNEAEIGSDLSQDAIAASIPLENSGKVVGYLIPEGGVLDLPDDFEELLVARVNQATLLAALISGAIAILLGLILAAIIVKPIRGLTQAAVNMSAGDLSQRVKVRGGGEITTLGKSFNHMAKSLQGAEKNRMAMTADIAHELRNPLAIQRAHLEALQDGVLPVNEDNLTLIAEQNQQLTRLVEDLRMLALAEAGQLDLNKRMVDLSVVCSETFQRFEPQANSKNVQIILECSDQPVYASVDKERLQQIHDNLMQNALRYTPQGGWIKLSLSQNDHWAVTTFHNNGPKIAEAALDHLFERFYRADKARDRASGGTGLGLSIARQLAEAHGGTLTAFNHPDEGVVFKLMLPI